MPTELKPAHKIDRYAVDSSTIKAIGYEDGICVVEFANGSLFSYAMEHREFEKFAGAESKGKYFNQAIRGKFAGTKLTGKCATCGALGIIGETCPEATCGGDVRAVDRVHKESK